MATIPVQLATLDLQQLKVLRAQLDAAEAALGGTKETALRTIASKLEQAQALLTECEEIADLAGVEFTFEYQDIETKYNEQRDWESSSYNC